MYSLLPQKIRWYVRGCCIPACSRSLVRMRVDRDQSSNLRCGGWYGISGVCLSVMPVSYAPRSRVYPVNVFRNIRRLATFTKAWFVQATGTRKRPLASLRILVVPSERQTLLPDCSTSPLPSNGSRPYRLRLKGGNGRLGLVVRVNPPAACQGRGCPCDHAHGLTSLSLKSLQESLQRSSCIGCLLLCG